MLKNPHFADLIIINFQLFEIINHIFIRKMKFDEIAILLED